MSEHVWPARAVLPRLPRFPRLERTGLGSFARYGLAVLAVVAAALVQHALWFLMTPAPTMLFYPAVILVARFLGLRPAILATAVALPILTYWFLPPYNSFAIDKPDDAVDVALFGVTSVIISALIVRTRAAEAKAKADDTRRRTAEAARERAFAELRGVIEQCPIGIGIVRAGDRSLQMNPAGRAILGDAIASSPDAFPANQFLDREGRVIPREEWPSARALRGDRISGLEVQLRRTDGRLVPLLTNAAPLAGTERDDEPLSAVLAFQDISAIKELESLRVQWSAAVAHDLRQPISTIQMRTDRLARDRTPPTTTDVAVLSRATRRLTAMVQDILDASRLEVRQMPLSRHDTDMIAFVSERAEEARAANADRRFDLSVCIGPRDAIASVDPDRIAQVLDNLLSNAVKYGFATTPIRIEVGADDGNLYTSVSNQGDGIPKEELPRLFQRFRRTESSLKKGISGTGLGLYIARELVVAHGGEISCSSEPGATTTFRFTIPRRPRPA
jgi:signal transduction histidine kinase